VSHKLGIARITAIKLIEALEECVAGDQVVARGRVAVRGNVAQKTAGPLRMIQHVIHLDADLKLETFGEIESLTLVL